MATNNKSDPGLLQPGPFFAVRAYQFPRRKSTSDGGLGLAVALMDLVMEYFSVCQRPWSPTSFCPPTPHQGLSQATQDRWAQAFPAL